MPLFRQDTPAPSSFVQISSPCLHPPPLSALSVNQLGFVQSSTGLHKQLIQNQLVIGDIKDI